MLGTFGFSYVGLVYLLMLFIPNGFWAKRRPEGYKETAVRENKVLLVFERAGQALVTASALLFSNYDLKSFTPWTTWLIVSFAAMLLYEICWIRYFLKPSLKTMYGSLACIPVPLATLPVAGFLLLGIYGKVIWLIISAVICGIGHIGIHLGHARGIKQSD